MTATITASEVHQSKWGFHPCDRETFKMLKRLNFLRLQYLRQLAKHERWARKDIENRIVRKKGKPVLDANGHYITWVEPKLPFHKIFNEVEENYRRARYPKPTAGEVEVLTTQPIHIAARLHEAEKWYEESGLRV